MERVSSRGKWPRNFVFAPTGQWIVCTKDNRDNAVVFRVDADTGRLPPIGEPMSRPHPFCERFDPYDKIRSAAFSLPLESGA